MATVAYKCPNCASPLTYDGTSGKMICAACDSQFAQEDDRFLYARTTRRKIETQSKETAA